MPMSSHLLRWSTEMLPERARLSTFREEFARLNLALDVMDHSGGRPRIDVTYLPLGAVGVCRFVATPVEFVRHKHHLRDSRDQFGLNIAEAGPLQFANAGQEHVYDAGSACLVDRGRPLRVFGPRGGRVKFVTVEAAALRSLVAQPEDLSGRPVRPGRRLNSSTATYGRSHPSKNLRHQNWPPPSAYICSISWPRRSGRPPKLQTSLRSVV